MLGSVALFAFLMQVVHRHSAGVQLRAHAGRRLQQPALHRDGADRRPDHPRPASLGREPDDHRRGAAHGPGVPVGRIQETSRSHLAGRLRAAAGDAGVRADRISAALGQPGVLGHHGDHADRRAGARRGPVYSAIAGQRRRIDRRGDVRAILRGSRSVAAAADHAADRDSPVSWSAGMAWRPCGR